MRVMAVLLIVAMAGPEVGLGAEMFALLDGLGAELFLLCFVVGLRLYLRILLAWVRLFLERIDPYFFVPSHKQIAVCPGIVVHAIPLYVTLYLFLICGPSVTIDA